MKRAKGWANWKAILIGEIILSYMVLLTLVSYIRAPQEYRVETGTPLLVTSDFLPFSGEAAADTLVFRNDDSGAAVGYQGALRLAGLERISVSLHIACSQEYAGKTVYVDLYDYESGYDSPEQEEALTLQEGEYDVEFTLFPGENAPLSAQLRIFTVEQAGYLISGVTVCEEAPLSKISAGMLCVAGIIWLCTLTTAAYCWRGWMRGEIGNA